MSDYDKTERGKSWERVRSIGFQISKFYLDQATEDVRVQIRDVVNENVRLKRAFCQLGEEQSWLVSSGDQELLRRTVSFISLIDELAGWGPTFYYQLARLYQQATEGGLDYEQAVRSVAMVSNSQCRRGDGDSIRELLLTFDPTDLPT